MRLPAVVAALAALIFASAAPSALAQPAAPPAKAPAFVNVDDPTLCNAAGLAPSREQASGYAIPADKGGGTLSYVDESRAECQQVVGKKPSGQHRRPTICPLGSGRVQAGGVWVCRTQKLASGSGD